MVPPLLKLEFTQGPRAGESLEYKPGSTIRIGRIVRGNQIAIKDAGISTKHIRIESDSENWVIHDLGSSNGTILNSDTLDPDTPVNLRHGDTIKLGEYTSIVVNFVSDVQAQEHKLPPRPRRNKKRFTVPDPVELVQEKPKRRGSRLPKQDNASSKENGDEHELPKRTRSSRKRTVEDIADKEKELEVEVENDKKVNSRAGRPRKKEISAIVKEVEVPVEKKVNSRVRRGKNTKSFQKLDLDSVKLEVEDTPKAVEISDRKRATRSKQIENASLGLDKEDSVLEEKDERRTSRATRSKKTEIGGDSFMNLEMVLNQARKSRAKRKKMEQELSKSVVEMEAKNDDAGEEALKKCHVEEDKDNEAQKGFSGRRDDKEDETEGYDGSKRVDQVEIELRKSTIGEDGETGNLQETEAECRDEERECEVKEAEIATLDGDGSKRVEQVELELSKKSTLGEDDLSCTVIEDGETENLQDTIACEVEDAGCDEEKVEQESSNKNVERVKVDLGKMALGEWFDFMEVQLPKQIVEETEKMIEPMRSKTMRVHKHIAEQTERVV
ncbi:FHA domain-containing protein [Cardamine amara subsp. amara]|uniref:FHA domain-containing protein n=1 Tax=Cardamine amara subsp. amara TaxID=228776 RepID=A0ABD1AXA3_CARAN